MPFVTGAQILAFVGVDTPAAQDTQWADAVAAAVDSGITIRLNGATVVDDSELTAVALLAGAEAYKRREATFGLTGYADLEGNAIRVARDYLAGIAPMIDRYSNGPGIG